MRWVKQQRMFFFQIIIVRTIAFILNPPALTILQGKIIPFASHYVGSTVSQLAIAEFTGKTPVAPAKSQPPVAGVISPCYPALGAMMIYIPSNATSLGFAVPTFIV